VFKHIVRAQVSPIEIEVSILKGVERWQRRRWWASRHHGEVVLLVLERALEGLAEAPHARGAPAGGGEPGGLAAQEGDFAGGGVGGGGGPRRAWAAVSSAGRGGDYRTRRGLTVGNDV